MIWRALTLSAAIAIGFVACSSNDGASTTNGATDGGTDSQVGEGGTTGDGGVVIPDYVPCTTTFRYLPPAGTTPTSVAVTGEWNGFANPGVAMTGPASDGSYSVDVAIPPAPLAIDSDQPGLVGYKLLVDGNYILDPAGRYRKYVGGVENSAVKVADCHVPELALIGNTIDRPAAGQGHYAARLKFVDTTDKHGVDPASIQVTIRKDGVETPVTFTQNGPEIDADVGSLADGKYSLFVHAKDLNGTAAHALRLVVWIENETYDWRDTVMWMGVTDRVKDGDSGNNAAPTGGIDPRVDFQGGDYEGIRQIIHAGTLDQLGIRAIWLTPFNVNPNDSWVASDGVHQTMGYHGYWPIKPRDVDARFGGASELHALVAEAHAHGIRVIQDFVVNHVHQEHDYFKNHPEWFRTGCICGTDNCDWTTHRLDCLFATYLPDVNWTVPDVSEQYMADAKYWLDAFDIDGLRFDAVKHVEDAATLNMTSAIRDEFEASGTKVFMTGETAMGWSNCGLTCNDNQYATIAHYIGDPTKGGGGLDGQFDFVTYYAVPMTAWDKDNGGGTHMPHADYWTQAAGWEYPAGAIMSQYVGSQDTPRFVTIASYRGQDGAHDPSIPGNQWSNIATAPPDEESYARQRLAMTWLLTVPGAPMIYYGDEYAEWGGADPNNRVMWYGDKTLNADETQTLALTKALGTARKNLVALRRGDYEPVLNTDETNLVFARVTSDRANVALVAMTLSATATSFSASIPASIPLSNGTVLHDRLGGPDVTVTGGAVSISLGARGAAILAP